MLGYAWQKGDPLSRSALRRAIELNRVQVDNNLTAFEWGRRVAPRCRSRDDAHGDSTAASCVGTSLHARRWRCGAASSRSVVGDIWRLIKMRPMPEQYLQMVRRVQAAERALGGSRLTRRWPATFSLMAYKDEYEVAWLLTDPSFHNKCGAVRGRLHRVIQLGAALVGRWQGGQGSGKHAFGPIWQPLLRSLPRLERLRGTWLDPFGYTADRRLDRALLAEYRERLELVLSTLRATNLARSIEIASVPDAIRAMAMCASRVWRPPV